MLEVAVLGAGGLGSYLGAVLHEAGARVHLVARGEHLRSIAGAGLRVTDHTGTRTLHIPASDGSTLAGADVAFVCVKTYSLDGVAPLAARLARSGTSIVPLMNGVTAGDDLIAAGVDAARLIPGIAYLTAFRTGAGAVSRQGLHGRLAFGIRTGHPDQDRLSMLVDVCARAGLVAESSTDLQPALWSKMAVVCTLTALCGPLQRPIGKARIQPGSADTQAAIIDEVLAVGRAVGVALGDAVRESVRSVIDGFDDGFFPSLVHDLRTSTPTEVGALNETIVMLGRNHGVPTPLHALAAERIRSAEASAT